MAKLDSFVIFAAGFSAGAAAGILLLKGKFKAAAEEEIRQMREYVAKKEAQIKEKEKEHSEWQKFEDEDEAPTSPNNFASLVKDEEAKSAYFKYATETPVNDIKKEDFDEMKERLERGEHPEEEHDAPYILSVEEFEDGRPGYDSIGLAYYEDDGSLVDDGEELVDVGETVGEENLKAFAESNDDAMYVRNDQFGVDYEVIRVEGSFYDDIFTEGDE